MKIVSVETEAFDVQFFHGVRRQTLVRIRTDDGFSGIGEAWSGGHPGPVMAAIGDVFKGLLLGQDSSHIAYLWQRMYRVAYRYGTDGIILSAISGIDLALWDLLGKRHNVPVASLLGGPVKDSVRVYASFPSLGDEEILTENLNRMMDAGFLAVKLHDCDERLVELTRQIVGDDFTIMLDPTGSWSFAQAEEMAKRVEQFDILWIEEPLFPTRDYTSLLRLRQNAGGRFAAGENEFGLDGFDRLMKSGAVDFVQPELSKMGGLTAARKLAVMAEVQRFPVCPHCYVVGPAFYAGIQLGVTEDGMDWHELKWLPGGLDCDVVSPVEVVGGAVELPKRPGLGFEALVEFRRSS